MILRGIMAIRGAYCAALLYLFLDVSPCRQELGGDSDESGAEVINNNGFEKALYVVSEIFISIGNEPM